MLLCVLLCLVIGSFADAVDQSSNGVGGYNGIDDIVPKPPIDIDDTDHQHLFDTHDNPLWKYNDTNIPPSRLGPKARPKIKCVSSDEPPYDIILDASGSRGRKAKWTQLEGDSPGYYKHSKKRFVYKANKSGYYRWRLEVWIILFSRRDTAYISCTIIDNNPKPRADMYWLGNSIYMDASKSTDDHHPIVKYEWKQIRGDKHGYTRAAKSFVYRTSYNGYYKWKLCVHNSIGQFRCTMVAKYFRFPGPRPSVRAAISAQWYTIHWPISSVWPMWSSWYYYYYRKHIMVLSGTDSFGMINKYVWIMEMGDDQDLIRYGPGTVYTTSTGGLYIWKLLVIGADNTHHYTMAGHFFQNRRLFPPLPGGLRAVPKLIPGIGNITLDATSSTGNISRVHWEQTSGDHVGDTFSEPRFSIPYPRSGECTYRLTVFGTDGEMSEEEVSLPDGVLDNWRELIGVEEGDLVEEPDTPSEDLEGLLDGDDNPFWNNGNAPEVGNPPSDNPPE